MRGGWLQDTLVVLFSDHGEAFGEHGTVLHGNSLHDEEIHVPLVAVGPGIAPSVVTAPASRNEHVPSGRHRAPGSSEIATQSRFSRHCGPQRPSRLHTSGGAHSEWYTQ